MKEKIVKRGELRLAKYGCWRGIVVTPELEQGVRLLKEEMRRKLAVLVERHLDSIYEIEDEYLLSDKFYRPWCLYPAGKREARRHGMSLLGCDFSDLPKVTYKYDTKKGALANAGKVPPVEIKKVPTQNFDGIRIDSLNQVARKRA